jgi:hypothetical protein
VLQIIKNGRSFRYFCGCKRFKRKCIRESSHG